MNNYLDRSISLIGLEAVKKMQDKTIMVIGLGGVGGTALEALARSGFLNFIIVDADNVDSTNLNRQIMYLEQDVGKAKVDVCENRLKSISTLINVEKHQIFIDENNIDLFKDKKIDYVVDAIDSVDSKIAIYKFCLERNIPFISSLGMGKRIDPSSVCVMKLNKTEGDPLARKIRYECKKQNINLNDIKVVFSKEAPLNSEHIISSMIMVPSTAGLQIAKEIICSYK